MVGAGHVMSGTSPDGSLQVLTKGIQPPPDNVLLAYIEGHEEGHVLDFLGRYSLLREWFRYRGFDNINPYELKTRGTEYLSVAVGLAVILSEGHRDIPNGFVSSSGREEREMLLLLNRERK